MTRNKSTSFMEDIVGKYCFVWITTSEEAMAMVCRIREAKQSGDRVIDVDGSYLWRKYQRMSESGVSVVPIGIPSLPLTGWESVTEANHKEYADKIPRVTAGNT